MSTPNELRVALRAIADPARIDDVARFYRGGDPDTRILGVPIGSVFPVAKRFTHLDLAGIEDLLEDAHYEVRMAAVAVMDFQAQSRSIDLDGRRGLYDLYRRRHDRIDNWDLVDRAAPRVIGGYLVDRDRSPLYDMARSRFAPERRTAIVATHAFLRRGETADTFAIAALLAADDDPYAQKAIASWVREAGKQDEAGLTAFLAKHRDSLPRATLRDASRNLPDPARTALLA